MMYLTNLLKGQKGRGIELDRWEEVERRGERKSSKAKRVNNVLNLTQPTPRVPVIVIQGGLGGGGR